MNASVDWKEVKYDEVFEQELRGLKRRREAEGDCTVEDIEGTLQHLYIMDGHGWDGRGDVSEIVMAATIAAYEHFIAEWRAETAGRRV